ncbi:unnamed protein product [Sphagnum tenellum]
MCVRTFGPLLACLLCCLAPNEKILFTLDMKEQQETLPFLALSCLGVLALLFPDDRNAAGERRKRSNMRKTNLDGGTPRDNRQK